MRTKIKSNDVVQSGATRKRIDSDDVGRRLDNYLLSILKGIPKSHIYRIIRSGEVRVDGGRIKPSYRLQLGEQIRVPPLTLQRPSSTPLVIDPQEEQHLKESILYEDDTLLVINKPAGYAMHAGSRCNFGLTEMLRQIFNNSLVPVHRLDQNTSGCLLFAKTKSPLRKLHDSFRQQEIDKQYLALVIGQWDAQQTSVTAPLSVLHQRLGARVSVDEKEGRVAETRFEVMRQFNQWTLLKVYPLSGRMHQIRVHAAYCDHPIAGDQRYGDFAANRKLEKLGLKRIFLHAERLTFDYDGKRFDFTAPLPDELTQLLDVL